MEFFLVRIFPSVFSPNVGKNGPEKKIRVWTLFTQCYVFLSGLLYRGLFHTSGLMSFIMASSERLGNENWMK